MYFNKVFDNCLQTFTYINSSHTSRNIFNRQACWCVSKINIQMHAHGQTETKLSFNNIKNKSHAVTCQKATFRRKAYGVTAKIPLTQWHPTWQRHPQQIPLHWWSQELTNRHPRRYQLIIQADLITHSGTQSEFLALGKAVHEGGWGVCVCVSPS